MSVTDDELAEVVRRECALLDPGVRADPKQVRALLHPDFLEFGSSGRVWDVASTIPALAADPAVDAEASDFAPVRLGPDIVLLTYRLVGSPTTLRSSVWVRDTGEWRMRFHQGTRVPD